MFFVEEKQTENRVFGSNFLIMPGRRKSSRQRGLSFSGTITRSRAGKANNTASVPRGRQTERPAVESPHDGEARLFQGRLRDRERARRTILLLFQEADRQNARASKVLTTERLVFSSTKEMERGSGHITFPLLLSSGLVSVATYAQAVLLNLIWQYHNNFCLYILEFSLRSPKECQAFPLVRLLLMDCICLCANKLGPVC